MVIRGMTLMRRDVGPPDPTRAAGRPRLSVVEPAGDGLGADALALPSELALLLRVALPLAAHRQRQAAVGFAVEDLVAKPLEACHVVLGPELGPGEYLAVVVDDRDMAQWAPRALAAKRRLVPDVLGLPIPPTGQVAVRELAGRVLVRRPDGTGYATAVENIDVFWRVENSPQIVLYGGRLPEGLPVSATGLMPPVPTAAGARVDLLQGRYAHSVAGRRRLVGRLATVAALALVAHGAILGAETLALRRIAQDRTALLRSELAARLPDLPASAQLDVALRRALPEPARPQGGFLPLMAHVSEALAPLRDAIALRNLSYDAAAGSLAVTMEASDLATLQRVEAALGASGLAVASGVATTGDGAAEVRYVITGGGG